MADMIYEFWSKWGKTCFIQVSIKFSFYFQDGHAKVWPFNICVIKSIFNQISKYILNQYLSEKCQILSYKPTDSS